MRRPPRTDVLIPAALLLAMGVEQAFGRGLSWADLLFVPGLGALAWRRTHPVTAAVLVIALLTASEFAEPRNTNAFTLFVAVVLALFSLVAYAQEGRARLGAPVAAALVVALAIRAGFNDPQDGDTDASVVLGQTVFALLVISLPAFALGYAVRRHQELRARLEAQATELESERELHAAAAALEERERMASDLHDVVAEGVRAMLGGLTTARELALRDPDRAGEAILAVEERGRDALTELRSLLGVLRRGDDDLALAPQPSVARLDELGAHLGRDVTVRVHGSPQALTPGLDAAAYRVVEEALRLAVTGPGEVDVRWEERVLVLEVAVPGPELADVPGLRAARERVALFDGRLDAGRRPRGGSAIAARLPLQGDHVPVEARA